MGNASKAQGQGGAFGCKKFEIVRGYHFDGTPFEEVIGVDRPHRGRVMRRRGRRQTVFQKKEPPRPMFQPDRKPGFLDRMKRLFQRKGAA